MPAAVDVRLAHVLGVDVHQTHVDAAVPLAEPGVRAPADVRAVDVEDVGQPLDAVAGGEQDVVAAGGRPGEAEAAVGAGGEVHDAARDDVGLGGQLVGGGDGDPVHRRDRPAQPRGRVLGQADLDHPGAQVGSDGHDVTRLPAGLGEDPVGDRVQAALAHGGARPQSGGADLGRVRGGADPHDELGALEPRTVGVHPLRLQGPKGGLLALLRRQVALGLGRRLAVALHDEGRHRVGPLDLAVGDVRRGGQWGHHDARAEQCSGEGQGAAQGHCLLLVAPGCPAGPSKVAPRGPLRHGS